MSWVFLGGNAWWWSILMSLVVFGLLICSLSSIITGSSWKTISLNMWNLLLHILAGIQWTLLSEGTRDTSHFNCSDYFTFLTGLVNDLWFWHFATTAIVFCLVFHFLHFVFSLYFIFCLISSYLHFISLWSTCFSLVC